MLTSLLEKCVLAIIRQFEPRFCCSWASVSFSRHFCLLVDNLSVVLEFCLEPWREEIASFIMWVSAGEHPKHFPMTYILMTM